MPDGVLLVGCGKMGQAMLCGWLETGTADRIVVVEPSEEARAAVEVLGAVPMVAGPEELPATLRPSVVVLAVKPQMMDATLPAYRRFVAPDTVFLSVAAGRNLASFSRVLGAAALVVRAMPNTPAAVRRGISALCAGSGVRPEQREACAALLAAVGEVVWVDDEKLMDAVTAVSGGGPAYVFLLVEALAEAGVAAGLAPELSARLAAATVTGAAELLRAGDDSPETLRRNVTSPGGTTEAALGELMAEDGLPALMRRAVAAAVRRSRELSG